ncbi:MAG: hypothetical protein WC848_05215 [Parcubacteria group bacterium]|jgi:hypothetical protein
MFEMPEAMKETSEQEWKESVGRQNVLTSLERIGFHESLHQEIIGRLVLLEKESKFNDDSRKIEQGMENVLKLLENRYSEQNPALRLSAEQKSSARIAAILHDIGKSGPVDATLGEQEMIIKIFACENIRDPKLLLEDEIMKIFEPSQIEDVQWMLEKYTIDKETTMRDFWDKHAYWTRDILEKYPQGLDSRTRIIAGSHHIDHDVDPYGLAKDKGATPSEARVIGLLEDYADALQGKALIALDQYEAAVRRRKFSHAQALAWVRNNLIKFKDDKLMGLIFEAIDELGEAGKIFQRE